MVVGCPSGPPDYKDVTKEHNKGEKKVCLHLYINIYVRAGYKNLTRMKINRQLRCHTNCAVDSVPCLCCRTISERGSCCYSEDLCT